MRNNLRAQLLGELKRRFAVVEVPELGAVRIRSINERERQELAKHLVGPRANRAEGDARFVVAAVVDDEGNPIFHEGDVQRLLEQDAATIHGLSEAIQNHWGLTQSFAVVKKNFAETAAADSR